MEYSPCVLASDCWGLMKELLQTVVGNLADSPPSVLKMKMDELYTPAITMSQYLELFNNFRKMATPTQISR